MGNSTTTYDVRIRYMLASRATHEMRRFTRETERAARASTSLTKNASRFAVGAISGFGLVKGVKMMIGLNSSTEQAKIQMAAMLAMTSKGKDTFNSAFGAASKVVDRFTAIAAAGAGATRDYVRMAGDIVHPIRSAGLGMNDLVAITKGAVVASRAFRIETGMAARDIEAVLMGQFKSVDRFARKLLEPMGVVGEKGREAFNKLSAAQRAAFLKSALTQPAITQMAKAQEKSFAGSFSALQEGLQIFAGKVGLPLFRRITDEIKSWNSWMDKNASTVDRWATQFGSTILDVFGVLKTAVSFFVEHKDTLITIAKLWAAAAIGKRVGGMVGALGGRAGGAMARAGGGIGAFGGMQVSGRAGWLKTMTDKSPLQRSRTGRAFGAFGRGVTNAGTAVSGFAGTVARMAGPMALFAVGIHELGGALMASANAERARERERIIRETRKMATVSDPKYFDPKSKFFGGGFSATVGKLVAAREKRIGYEREAGMGKFAVKAKGRGVLFDDRAAGEAKKAKLDEMRIMQQIQPHLGEVQKQWKSLAALAIESNLVTAKHLSGVTELNRGTANITMSSFTAAKSLGVGANQLVNIRSRFSDFIGELEKSGNVMKTLKEMMAGGYLPSRIRESMGIGMDGNSDLSKMLKDASKGSRPRVSVTIQKIEVQSDDPDDFVFGLTEAFEDSARNPSSAINRFRLLE